MTLSQFVHLLCSEPCAALKSCASELGAEIMTAYRIYVVNPEGHVTDPPQIVECANDQEAISRARQRLGYKAVEIWDGPRRVAGLEAHEY